MIRFSDQLDAVMETLRQRQRDVFLGTAEALQQSMVEGSAVTGSPGQPVDTSALKGSWQETFPGEWQWQTTTNVVYAPGIEEGEGPHGPMTLRSEVGGFHSRKLTVAGFDDLVDSVVREVVPQ